MENENIIEVINSEETSTEESSKEENKNKEEKKKENIKFALSLIIYMIIGVLISFFIKAFILTKVLVSGLSMYPTFDDGDVLLMWKLGYSPKNNDIVVIHNDFGETGYIIKRCIGVAGDTVRVDYEHDKVTVNGQVLNESYINESDMFLIGYENTDFYSGGESFEYTIPEDTIFVMGDNRNNSLDSRSSEVGFISTKDVSGKVFFRFDEFKFV